MAVEPEGLHHRGMAAPATWTCGCGGAAPAGGPCPECGWSRDDAGQLDRSARRWWPLAAAVLVCTLSVDGVVVAKGLGETTVHRIEEDGDATPSIADALDDLSTREVPADLGVLVPTALPGLETLSVPDVTGPLTLEQATVDLFQPDLIDDARSELRDLGFLRAHGAAFAGDDHFVGVYVWEFGSAGGAEQFVEAMRARSFIDPGVERLDVPYLDDEVAMLYELDGQHGLDVWYQVDQLAVCEFAARPAADPTAEDLRALHDDITTRLGT